MSPCNSTCSIIMNKSVLLNNETYNNSNHRIKDNLFKKKQRQNLDRSLQKHTFAVTKRKVAGVNDRGGLEIRCTACPYRGFESLTFRTESFGYSEAFFLFFSLHYYFIITFS